MTTQRKTEKAYQNVRFQRMFYTVAFTVLLLSSCKHEQHINPTDSIYPMKTGNTWTYQRSYINKEGNTVLIDTITQIVEGPTTIDGIKCYKFNNFPSHSPYNLAGNDKYGNFITYGYADDELTFIRQSTLFKHGAEAGQKWRYKGLYWNWNEGASPVSYTIQCISTDTLISTPLQQFHCMAFQYTLRGIEYTHYLSKGIGLIKVESSIDHQTKNRHRKELICFKLN